MSAQIFFQKVTIPDNTYKKHFMQFNSIHIINKEMLTF